ncbi:polysaccharide biosynthesis/export family protein [Mucilaginibacter mali]|uniref:Polysaccharide biosynthesis/export family protein n=1 Tax=Mucilaginibacter mali TaxID=2740462 RepID=A0A7D4TYN9_9SPHI|nr:polysaccharide biosynthesis/export family protein [Mucilaginibacter mali]QKJ31497.1 polysaccharide biosynthesis/export family protein [Mucilaginibacter mali]
MKRIIRNIPVGYFLVLMLVLTLHSCSTIKNYKYFEDISDTAKITRLTNAYYKEPIIQADDILYIFIQTADPQGGNLVNALNTPAFGSGTYYGNIFSASGNNAGQSMVYGYLVNKKGEVTLPVLGDVNVLGLSTAQARTLIVQKASIFYKDPSVTVRFANFKITVLGEVAHPGTYSIPNEKINLLDALGYAGDLTIYGDRTNLLLVRRQTDGSTLGYRLNLNNSEIFKSPYFYLQQNDEIYVTPTKAKITSSDAAQARNITVITSALTVLVVLLTRIR